MTFKYENKKLRQGFAYVAGCDEVGRGSLAGPVVAAAVVISSSKYKVVSSMGVKDSKLLTPKKREELSSAIKKCTVAWSIGEVSSAEVDELNIHQASLLAMRRSVENLAGQLPAAENLFLYIDGKFIIPPFAKATDGKFKFHLEQEAVVGGDNKVLSVAAASIVAKVYRDELMREYDEQYPLYNFAQHKGYATFHHRQMVREYGLSDIHRVSFCRQLVN